MSGSFEDLYDFSYWGGTLAQKAACVQAGFATLSTSPEPAGRVFFTRVEFLDTQDWNENYSNP